MDFKEYQEKASLTDVTVTEHAKHNPEYYLIAMAEEVGEVCGQWKKLIRDDSTVMTIEREMKIHKELGDLLWYLAGFCRSIGVDLEKIAEQNIEKLQKRQLENKIHGDGSNR